MLRFFRKIRMQLLKENKVTRYLLYAVGEIALVVLGILIALQVNNWNQARKDRISELLVLTEIKADLEIDLEEFDRNMTHLKNQQLACRRLLEIASDDLAFQESYSVYFFYFSLIPRFTPKTAGYELLQTKGLDLVSDDELRRSITDLYEFGYPYIQAKEEDLEVFYSGEVRPASVTYLGTESLGKDIMPEDIIKPESVSSSRFVNMRNFEAFKRDEDFLALVKRFEIDGASYLFSHEYSVRDIQALMEMLEAAIGSDG